MLKNRQKQLQKTLNILLLKKYKNLENIRKLGIIVGITNIINCFIFYFGLFLNRNQTNPSIPYLLIISTIIHLYLNLILIIGSLPYEGAKGIFWAGLSLIFVAPLGTLLVFACNNEKNGDKNKLKVSDHSFIHSFLNSFINLNELVNKSYINIKNTYPDNFQDILNNLNITTKDTQYGTNKEKYSLIALDEAIKQTKKKNTYEDIVFNARGYDEKHFDFAIKDPTNEIMPIVRYKYSLAFIVLDEFNNYQKIIEAKKEVKSNLKFGTSKTICIHGGKGFKIYVNE